MRFNFNNADIIIEKKNEMYSEKYKILYNVYDRAYRYESENYETFILTNLEIDAIDFWLDYIINPLKVLDPLVSGRVMLMMHEIMHVILSDHTSIELRLKYNPEGWMDYLDQYGNYIRFPNKIKRKKLFVSKEDILHANGF